MVATVAGRQLTEAYRVQQARISAGTMLTAMAMFPALVEGDDDEMIPRWLAALVALMRRQGQISGRLAQQYMAAYRVAELGLGGAPFTLPEPRDINEEQVITSMMVTGPVAFRKASERAGVERLALTSDAARKVMESNARAVQRHVANVGRDLIEDVALTDRACRGHVRVTDGDPCYFCAMLASRGPVYEDDSFDESDPRFEGPGNHKVHDGCGCLLVPVYGPAPILAQTRMYEKRWIEASDIAKDTRRNVVHVFRELHNAARL